MQQRAWPPPRLCDAMDGIEVHRPRAVRYTVARCRSTIASPKASNSLR
jgi:hypothetical protein